LGALIESEPVTDQIEHLENAETILKTVPGEEPEGTTAEQERRLDTA
jgi:hypothetical protein